MNLLNGLSSDRFVNTDINLSINGDNDYKSTSFIELEPERPLPNQEFSELSSREIPQQ